MFAYYFLLQINYNTYIEFLVPSNTFLYIQLICT